MNSKTSRTSRRAAKCMQLNDVMQPMINFTKASMEAITHENCSHFVHCPGCDRGIIPS